jgi:malate/lactate dehydrogenase
MQTREHAAAACAARVAVVGTGYVGSTTAYALLISGTAAEIVLIDRDSQRAKGHVQDLKDAELFSHTTRVLAGEFADCGSADVVIVTAGVGHRPGSPRLEYLREMHRSSRGSWRKFRNSTLVGFCSSLQIRLTC